MKNFGRESRVLLYKRRFFISVIVITVLYCAYNRVLLYIWHYLHRALQALSYVVLSSPQTGLLIS